jgi:Zn-dependent protease with chaperone function
MYSQLLYFIVALLLFTIQQPGNKPLFPPTDTLFLGVGIFLCFLVVCRQFFRPIRTALRMGFPLSLVSLRYHRAQTRLSILALVNLAIYVYVLNIKFYLQSLPGFDDFLTLSELAGLGIFLLHLGVIWTWSYPIYKTIHSSQMTRAAFLRGNIAFSSAILIPWLLISFLFDLLDLLKMPAFLSTDAGQFFIVGTVLIVFLLFAPWFVVRLWGCQTMAETPVRADLEDFCRQHGFKVGDFMYWPLFGGEILTAGVMGILPRLRYILVTKGLLSFLGIDEMKAVVAHEMGHVRRYHLFFYLVFFVCFSVLTYCLNDVILVFLLSNETLLRWAMASDTLHLTLFSAAYSVPILVMLVVYFRYVFGFFLRNSERQADLYALQLIGHPNTLISSLEKIALFSGHIRDVPSWHHFSIRQRVEFLLAAQANPKLIKRHHQKLYGTALIFLLVMGGLSYGGLNLENTKVVRQWQTEIEVRLMERGLLGKSQSADIYAAYGGLLLELGRFGKAESALLNAHRMAPRDATVLNNLAWFYATSPPPYSDPKKALELSLEAASMEPEPHILDTLAEAYYANRLYEKALETIQQALTKQPKKRDYYLGQEKKFKEALKNEKAG